MIPGANRLSFELLRALDDNKQLYGNIDETNSETQVRETHVKENNLLNLSINLDDL